MPCVVAGVRLPADLSHFAVGSVSCRARQRSCRLFAVLLLGRRPGPRTTARTSRPGLRRPAPRQPRTAITGAKADERQTLLGILDADPALAATRPGQAIIADRHYYGTAVEAALAGQHLRLLRPARKGEQPRPGAPLFKPLRQTIESINQTFKAQLDLERHGGHTPAGVIVRVLQRILALTTAIWHNDHAGQPVMRSLIAYDH